MLSSFRRLSKSAVGSIILVLFLLGILASFALADITNVGGSLGAGGDALVEVGDRDITDRDLDQQMRRALAQAQQQDPEATYASIAGQFGAILDGLIDEEALLAFAADHGFILSKRLIDAEIAQLPQTRGLDGKFSQQAYAAFLQQQRLSDAELRRLIEVGLTQRLIMAPAAVDARVPLGVARPYADMLLERRQGQLALVPADRFMAGLNPSDGDLQSFYSQNRQRYMVAEQRVLRVAKIGPEAVAGIKPTDAEIAAFYKANQATYGGAETRVISQVVVPDRKVADSVAAKARSGASFVEAAAPTGFSAEEISVGPQSRSDFAKLANDAVAAAAFGAAKGAIVGPVKSDLGWHVIKIDDVRAASGKSLGEARAEIAALLATNKRKQALTDLVTRVEDQIADGASFAEAATAAKLAVVTTPPINSQGLARRDAAYRFPAELAPALQPGFMMAAEDDPEVVTLPGEAGYALVGVERIIEAAPAPLAEIRDRVRTDWINRKALDRARAVASDIAAKVTRGMALDKAAAEAGAGLPRVESIDVRRMQIAQANADAAPALRMLFTLAEGKSRLVADPSGRGFVIVKTNKVTPGNALGNPALIAQTQAAFQQTASNELGAQFLAAMKADQGIERNEKAIAAARQRITSSGQ
ncbi:MAG TPA: peptidyl-prolyl cis-trans isomerase [Sphingomicrobium sp.]|nr:peptidyl-prolyl cis-trans isomerase [Sphingomicrobium sp.]